MRFYFLLPSVYAFSTLPLTYNPAFQLPLIPLLQQAKFLDLNVLLTRRQLLGINLKIPILDPILQSLQLPPLLFDDGWKVQVVPAGSTGAANAWSSMIRIGTPPQTLNLVLDSGSADLVVFDPACRTCSLGTKQPYRYKLSRTHSRPPYSFEAHYGSSGQSVSGYTARDVVGIGAAWIPNQQLAVVTNMSSQFELPSDGLVGLAQDSLSSIPNTKTVFSQLVSNRQIEKPLIGIALTQSVLGNGGEYRFGGINSALLKGPIIYFPVTSSFYWGTALDDIIVKGRSILSAADPRRVVFDTGTTLNLVSDEVAIALHASVPGARYLESTDSWTVPCRGSGIPVAFKLGGQAWTLPPSDMAYRNARQGDTCLSSIQGGMRDFYVLGDVFIKNFYLVLHQGDKQLKGKHVGLGLRRDL